MNAADTSASRATAACTPLAVVSRSRTTAEIETFMNDVSMTKTNIAIASSTPRRGVPDAEGESIGAVSRTTDLAEDGLERHADQLEPPGEAAGRELADLLLGDAEQLARPVAVAGRLQGLGDGREQPSQRVAHRLAELGALAHRLAQEPHAVADVPRLVVMHLVVALDEARQQALPAQVVGDELEGGQAERALEHEVVERHEADLRGHIAGVREELVVQLDERAVDELTERVRDLLAGALDMSADRLRFRDHLVAEARVELHVASFVDLLGPEETLLLLRRLRRDQAGELRRDALLGDHQRGQREVDDLADLRVE